MSVSLSTNRLNTTAVAALIACSGARTTNRPATAGPVPPAIVALGEGGEDAYDAVGSGRWATAQSLADSVTRAAAAVPSTEALGDSARGAAADLAQAVRRHDRNVALGRRTGSPISPPSSHEPTPAPRPRKWR